MDLAADVGRRLRALREERGLSLSALARRSGVGKGTLSELESGRRNPTLETLYALTTALDLPLSSALHGLAAPARVAGAAVEAVLVERFETPEAVTESYRVRIRAHARQLSAPHAPGTTEHLVLLAGTAEVGPADAPVALAPGGHHTWPADTPHGYAAGPDPAEALLIIRTPR